MRDSTTIDLWLKLFLWARFRTIKAAIKIHTLLQADGTLPAFVTITDRKVHDVTAAKQLKIPKASFEVFNRGYHDFELYNSYGDNGIHFATWAKTNVKHEVLNSLPVDSSNGNSRPSQLMPSPGRASRTRMKSEADTR